jgi:hypothetical protein
VISVVALCQLLTLDAACVDDFVEFVDLTPDAARELGGGARCRVGPEFLHSFLEFFRLHNLDDVLPQPFRDISGDALPRGDAQPGFIFRPATTSPE